MMIKHCGIYVQNIDKMTSFYKSIFDMYEVFNGIQENSFLLDELLEEKHSRIKVVKLITEYGKIQGIGDMLELIEVIPAREQEPCCSTPIWQYGTIHIAFNVADIEDVVDKIILAGGQQKTQILDMGNGRLCCFCVDPENNWLELISPISNTKNTSL